MTREGESSLFLGKKETPKGKETHEALIRDNLHIREVGEEDHVFCITESRSGDILTPVLKRLHKKPV